MNLDTLDALAAAADWTSSTWSEADRAYVSAASPDVIRNLIAVARAAENLSDRRTLDSDGFWVSQKEMRALDDSLRALGLPSASAEGEGVVP